jgi:hypothetical protein
VTGRDPRAEWTAEDGWRGFAGDVDWVYGGNDRLAALRPQLAAADALALAVMDLDLDVGPTVENALRSYFNERESAWKADQ